MRWKKSLRLREAGEKIDDEASDTIDAALAVGAIGKNASPQGRKSNGNTAAEGVPVCTEDELTAILDDLAIYEQDNRRFSNTRLEEIAAYMERCREAFANEKARAQSQTPTSNTRISRLHAERLLYAGIILVEDEEPEDTLRYIAAVYPC